jgi:hypothetical protein
MNIQKAMKTVERPIKLVTNIPVTMVIMLVTTPMAMVKAAITAVPARKSPASGKAIKQPIVLPPFPQCTGEKSCYYPQ